MTDQGSKPALTRPASATHQWISLLGVVGFLCSVYLLHGLGMSRFGHALLCMLGTAVPMMIADLWVRKVHRGPSTGLVFGKDREGVTTEDRRRVAVKLLGAVCTLAVLAIVYLVVPEYQRTFYHPVWNAALWVGPPIAVLAIPYFLFIDSRMREPRDGYWSAGCFVMGRFEEIDWHILKHHGLGWIIKGFYLPLMFVYLSGAVSSLAGWDLARATGSMVAFVAWASKLSLAVDLAFVVIGYSLTLRLMDSHIRTANPYMYGWAFTLVLYQPFWSIVGKRYFRYSDGNSWSSWMSDWPTLIYIWGAAIVISKLGWAWSNLTFGIRFSNLTHRGILTNGPYRFTKHPSYVFKNISWWLLSVPFLSHTNIGHSIRNSLMLFGVSMLYFIRARAEEQHLSEDPVYVQYALWMNGHGAFRRLARWIPFLRYRPPASRPAS